MSAARGRLVRIAVLGGVFAALWLLIAVLPLLTVPTVPWRDTGGSGARDTLVAFANFIMLGYWPLLVLAALVVMIWIGRKFREAVQAASPVTATDRGVSLLLRSFGQERAIVSEWLPSLFSTSLEGRLAYHFEQFGSSRSAHRPTRPPISARAECFWRMARGWAMRPT
jgi:hypothetical protein